MILILFILLLIILIIVLFMKQQQINNKQQDTLKPAKDLLQESLTAKDVSFDFGDISANPVILQSFDQIGLTLNSWKQLEVEIPELSTFFSVIWIPPVSKSTSNPGYIPLSYTDLGSYWGSEQDLINLVQTGKKHNVEMMADMVLHHSATSDPKDKTWWQTDIVTYKTPTDYLSAWQYDRNFRENGELNRDGKRVIDSANKGTSCVYKDENSWKVNRECVPPPNDYNCDKVYPMYGIDNTTMDEGGLQALNLCNLDILRAQMAFIRKLYSIGITNFRWDQLDGFDYRVFQLYLNSDIKKTPEILKNIKGFCQNVRSYPDCPAAYKNQLADQIDALLESGNNLREFTGVPHDLCVGEAFTGRLYPDENAPHESWWTLTGEIERINTGLNQQDYTGVFDFAFKDLLRNLFIDPQNPSSTQYFAPNVWSMESFDNTLVGTQNQKYSTLSYTFITNHDTDNSLALYAQSWKNRGFPDNPPLPLAYIPITYFINLMMPGYPTIFKYHYNWFKTIVQSFILLRYMLNIRYDSKVINMENQTGDQAYIGWVIENGDGEELLIHLDVVRQDSVNLVEGKTLVYSYVFERPEGNFTYAARVYNLN